MTDEEELKITDSRVKLYEKSLRKARLFFIVIYQKVALG